ncbi:MAG: DUF447 family protein, partial [Crenarchaeota archaeon]|nr:DUF447 family protein [Thermoproteota archaeon]
IVATYNSDGQPNAAPMGVSIIDEQHLTIKPFNSSTTLTNLKSSLSATVNLTSNIELFYKTAFKKENQDEIPKEWFEDAKTINTPQLQLADAVIGVSVEKISQLDSERSIVLCKVEFIEAKAKLPKGYCRAFAATIEAIIHATRIKAFSDQENKQENINKLVELINNCKEIINRTAPNSKYSKILEDIETKIESWGKKNASIH